MIRILTKKAFRFQRHGAGPLSKPVEGETFEEATKRVMRDATENISKKANNIRDHYVDVALGEVKDVPDWVREDNIFKWGTADGDIMELVLKSAVNVAGPAGAGETLVDAGAAAKNAEQNTADDEAAADAKEEEEEEAPSDPGNNMEAGELPVKPGTGVVRSRKIAGVGGKGKQPRQETA
jgi:hypothetical protein